jgi:tetratricopeptide (TPR) repeat protein
LKYNIITILLTTSTFMLQAQGKLDAPLNSLIVRGIDCIYRQEYQKADSIFCEAAIKYPDHPAGYLYQIGVMQQYAIDFSVPIERHKLDSLLDLGEKCSQSLDSPWREYFLAAAYGYDAYESIERGNWFHGVQKGLSSASKFEEVIEEDSGAYEAYVGVGTYYYWSSRETAFIRWLPFLKDKRELGINMLVSCAEHSYYNRFAAISSLISIYLDAENYAAAEKWSRRGLKYYPDNRIFLWGLTAALDRQKRPSEAAAAYKDLLNNILKVSSPHPYGELVCRLYLAKFALSNKDMVTAAEHLKNILSYEQANFPAALESRAKAKFKEAKNIYSALNVHDSRPE